MLSSVDVLARVLGAIGTAAGVVAAAVAFLTYRRDRAKVVLAWRVDIGGSGRTFTLVVTNDGGRPILIRDIGVQNWSVGDRPMAWNSRLRRWLRPLAVIPLARHLVPARKAVAGLGVEPVTPPKLPITLEPAGHISTIFDIEALRKVATGSGSLYAYATTILGRSVRTPLQREFMEYLRIPREELDARLTEALRALENLEEAES